MLDDDLCDFVEYNQLGMSQPSTIGKALSFCQLVMAKEKAATVERRVTTASDKTQVTSGYDEFVNLLEEVMIGDSPLEFSKEKRVL